MSLGYRTCGAPGHLQRVFRQGGAQGQHGLAPGKTNHGPVRLADEVVVRNGLSAVLKPVAGLEREGILPPFFINQMNALTWLKGRHRPHSRSLPLRLQLASK